MATAPKGRHRNRLARPVRTGPLALVLAAYPSRAAATRAARALVRDGALACATVVEGATAFYRWEGTSYEEPSFLLWGKCPWASAKRAVAAVKSSHPDRVPEILALRVGAAWPAYAAWVAASTKAASPRRRAARKAR